VGTPHAVAVNSGTAALTLACRAIGLGPGDEAIVPSMTFVATAHVVRFCGAEPVLCDVLGSRDFGLDIADVERRITPRTKAVLAVHFLGYTAAVTELRELCDERGLVLIEDCAQSIAARVPDGRQSGTVGHVGCFSFFSKKQLCVGEGGMVITDSEDLAQKVRSLRSHAMTSGTWDRHRGHHESYDVVDVGYNFRLDEPRSALGLSRLARLDEDIAARRAAAREYRARIGGLPGLELPYDDEAVERGSHFAFAVLLEDRAARDAFRSALGEQGVQTTWYPALHSLTAYRARAEAHPQATALADRHCALPMSPTLAGASMDRVVEAVQAALA
jgi:dTDP-4-amino-4,6-dideoxygalactose transaminase